MSEYDKKYDPFKIFEDIVSEEEVKAAQKYAERVAREASEIAEKQAKAVREYAERAAKKASEIAEKQVKAAQEYAERVTKRRQADIPHSTDMYYEIEYDSCPMPGVGKFVLKPQKIQEAEIDEVRELFNRMRDIARENRSLLHNSSHFYNSRIQQEKANIFYKQAVFMKDFEDDYENPVPYASYFPYYQMMGYEQLRTYFTWRTKVRKGIVTETSLSYVYLYLYELLSNIGVDSPQEGLEKLIFIWREFRTFNSSIDKYVLKWLKDYHIYYELPESFKEFVERQNLAEYYPNLFGREEDFDLYCAISKYDIRKSVFYTEDHQKLIKDCFLFVVDKLKSILEEAGVDFEEAIFQPTKNRVIWMPFKDALFHPWLRQRDRRVVLSEKEIYECRQNKWSFNTTLTTESGKQLVGYIMKQTEVALRQALHFKYKLSANLQGVDGVLIARLTNIGTSLEAVINQAVAEFYREATKTVVKVDKEALAKIRREALETQEKLIVEDENELTQMPKRQQEAAVFLPESMGNCDEKSFTANSAAIIEESLEKPLSATTEESLAKSMSDTTGESLAKPLPDTPWAALKDALNTVEMEALRLIIEGNANIKQFADAQGVMLEVLMDGINEKAMDFVGDSLLDDEFVLYEDYIEEVRSMLEGI